MKTTNKIVLIGSGAVGTSFLYSAISQGIAEEYGIIDLNPDCAKGNELDLEDALPSLNNNAKIVAGGYELVKDADLVVITAGRPQLPGETRLDMVAGNAKIMNKIAIDVKNNGFKGITLIAANPVDVMTTIYQKVTGFDKTKVISSSCSLDSARLQIALANIFEVSPTNISALVLGEHGDSSVSTLTNASISGVPLKDFYEEKGLTEEKLAELHESVWKKAYKIIEKKRATFYGIGAALANISKSILRDEKKLFATGAFLNGEYGQNGVYAGVPSIIGKEGIIKTYEFPLSEKEHAQFEKSIKILKEATEIAIKAIEE